MTTAPISLSDIASLIIASCAMLTLLMPFHKKQPKSATAEIVVGIAFIALILLAAFSRKPWAIPAVIGAPALSNSFFFMVKPTPSRADYLLIAMLWPFFFYLLSQMQ